MKIFIQALIVAVTMAFTFPSFSQTVSIDTGGKEIQLKKEVAAEIVSFSGKYNSGKVYLKWNAVRIKNNGVFIIYRSSDGISFEAIGSKQAIGVTTEKEVAYYFTDGSIINQVHIYKVLYVSAEPAYLFSAEIKAGTESATASNPSAR